MLSYFAIIKNVDVEQSNHNKLVKIILKYECPQQLHLGRSKKELKGAVERWSEVLNSYRTVRTVFPRRI